MSDAEQWYALPQRLPAAAAASVRLPGEEAAPAALSAPRTGGAR